MKRNHDQQRSRVATWAFSIVESFDLDRTVVHVMMTILDRYVCWIQQQNRDEVVNDDCDDEDYYKLVVLASLHLASKMCNRYGLSETEICSLMSSNNNNALLFVRQEKMTGVCKRLVEASLWSRMVIVQDVLNLLVSILPSLSTDNGNGNGNGTDAILEKATMLSERCTIGLNTNERPPSVVALACLIQAIMAHDPSSKTDNDMQDTLLAMKDMLLHTQDRRDDFAALRAFLFQDQQPPQSQDYNTPNAASASARRFSKVIKRASFVWADALLPLANHSDDDDEEEEKEAAPWIQTLDCALMESNNSSYNFKRKRSFRSMQQQHQHQEAHGYRTNKKNKQTRC